MANHDDIALMAHLMRRAGFGASRDELEARAAKGYDATVEELLNPDTQPPVDPYVLLRHQPAALLPGGQPPMGNVNYMYYLVNTKRPLEEKMALFWHSVFATGNSKVDNYDQLLEQIDLFRKHGMGNYRDLLLTIAKNPTMLFWLDNNQNHGTAVNENWGRELLELFSLGAGNYTESGCARGIACLHRLDVRDQAAAPALRPVPVEVRISRGRPRRRREDVPRPQGQPERRGHHRHRRAAAGMRQVHLPASVQLLRRRRAAGACVVDRRAARPGGDRYADEGVPREQVRDEAGADARCSPRTSSRTRATSTSSRRPRWSSARCVWSAATNCRSRATASCRCSPPTWARICSIRRRSRAGTPARSGSTAAP